MLLLRAKGRGPCFLGVPRPHCCVSSTSRTAVSGGGSEPSPASRADTLRVFPEATRTPGPRAMPFCGGPLTAFRPRAKAKAKAALPSLRKRGGPPAGSLTSPLPIHLETSDVAERQHYDWLRAAEGINRQRARGWSHFAKGAEPCGSGSSDMGPAKVAIAALVALVALLGLGQAKEAPNVQVYSRYPVTLGEENVLNCYVEGFHPPKIDITLLKNGQPMTNVQYSDMSFSDNWTFKRLVHATFTPTRDDIYVCKVDHEAFTEPQSFRWDPEY